MYIFEPKSYFPKPNQVLFLLKTNQTATDSQHEPHDDKVGVCLFVLVTVKPNVKHLVSSPHVIPRLRFYSLPELPVIGPKV